MLEVRELHAWYGKSHVLQGVNFQVAAGEIVSLLGRNGVGRSTTVKAIMGEIEPQGSILFKNRQIAGRKSFEIARLGLGYVPENREIFPTLTVRQNLLLGVKSSRAGNAGKSWPARARNWLGAESASATGSDRNAAARWSIDEVFAMFPLLAERADVPGGALSGGEQQLLSMCRSLMGHPDMIMIDEPTEGLAPKIVEQVGNLLLEIAGRGVAILLVEQKLNIALRISNRLYIMGHGRIAWEGTPDSLREAGETRAEWLEI